MTDKPESQAARSIPVIDIPSGVRLTYETVLAAGKDSLGPDEWWVIDHVEGPLWDTRSKWLTVPIRIFCEALKCDWDHAQDSGFRLAKLRQP